MTQAYLEHITKPGERWDLIAYRYYGNAKLLHHILKANPNMLCNPDRPVPLILEPGITLRIPVLEQAQIEAVRLPPWKQGAT
ncbi:hypothetical protein RA27_20580 [Ruegeria sp. ANG-R]|uniref:tail protein X n=1 Tax=Ruegeria sp. ANG-R TaxID=1577903 RepID=UPI00057F9BAD|nr:tail protein X [Ruegeria sp. ANG-R]KIC38162.1 hypothetical protein RA27_20580 [Ruegeria sp. ANG-R]